MNDIQATEDYTPIIKKIKRGKTIVMIVTIVVLMVLIIIAMPQKIEILEKTVYQTNGMHPALFILLLIVVFLAELFALGLVLSPLQKSLNEECDPRKYYVLNKLFNRNRKRLLIVYSGAYFYLGDYPSLFECSEQMIASGNSSLRFCGLFGKARGSYFTGDYETLTATAKQFDDELAGAGRIGKKQRAVLENWAENMHLLIALSQNDIDAVNRYRNIEAWAVSKAAEGYVNYLKGFAATLAGDDEEAIYRFKSVTDHCGKTVFARMAEELLKGRNSK